MAKYKILAFREYETPQTLVKGSFLSVIDDVFTTCGVKTDKDLTYRHLAIVRVKGLLFDKGFAMFVGEAAEEFRQRAIEAGVYEYGDPGKSTRDEETTVQRQPNVYRNSWIYNTASTSTSTTIYFYANS